MANYRCTCDAPLHELEGKPCPTGGWRIGGHVYTLHQSRVTFGCANGCGCVMARFNSWGPDGIDTHGECPNAKQETK